LAGGFKEPGWAWSVEKYYHHWFASDKHMLGLIRELGWEDNVIFPRPYTVMYHKGKFYPFDSIIKALLFPGLGFGLDKIRFGLVGLFLRLSSNWHRFEGQTVDGWMRKWAGGRVYEMMWEPLVIGKFSENYYRQVNMAWMWARLKARTTRLGTYKGGFQAFIDQFSGVLDQQGVELRRETAVAQIHKGSDGNFILEAADGESIFERVLVTLAPRTVVRMIPDLPAEYNECLMRLKSLGAVVLTLSLKQRLSEDGYYWFNLPKAEGYPFLALVEHTNFLSPEYFGGDHIVYLGDYLDPKHEYFRMTKEQLLERFLPALKKINPEFEPDWIKRTWLSRATYAQPVPLLNHSQNIPPIQTPISGLFYASMSQVYPWDRGTNYAVEIGRRAARLMLKSG
jgi:protoporphyrinogen oxidase